jgi:P4 family phage/plasmid primase-like protien
MATTTEPPILTARALRHGDFGIVWLRPAEKSPKRPGWQLKSQEPEDHVPGSNLGILCGHLSGDAVCVDIDSNDALTLADIILPPTEMIDGRPGKPRSHRWYRVISIPEALTAQENCAGGMGGPRSTKYSDPDGKSVIEFKGTGQQAVVPPSVWTNGTHQETRVWYDADGEVVPEPSNPAVVDCLALFEAVYQLASAVGAKPARWVQALKEPIRSASSRKEARAKKPSARKESSAVPLIEQAPPLTYEGPLLIPLSDRIYVARIILTRMPSARSGHRGHDTTYSVARTLVNDCALPRDAALTLLRAYNERLGQEGEEVWTDAELVHKIDSALAAPPSPSYPYGCKVLAEAITNPHRLAREFLLGRPIRYWRDSYFEYEGRRYVHVADKEMRALLTGHIASRFREEYQIEVVRYERRLSEWKTTGKGRRPKPPKLQIVRMPLLHDVTLAINAQALLRGTYPMPCLLPEGREPNLLALNNGILDVDNGILQPHTPDWFSSVCLPYAYDSTAVPVQWLAVLNRNLEGDCQRIGLLQEFFGYCLVRTTDGQTCLILTGEGNNGKSVILATLRAMLGADNIATVPLEHFAQRFALAQTLGKLANICPEIGELDRTAEGTLKSYVSGDTMFFEKKGKDGFSAPPTARLVVATNNLPRFSDRSEGIWRRLRIMPMTAQIPPEERRAGMDKDSYWTHSGELAGILNWALVGLRRLRSNGWQFTLPEVCRAALVEHRLESDPARVFLLEHYQAGSETDSIAAADLYQKYRLWCDVFGHRNPLANTTFGRQVRRLFPGARSQAVRCGKGGVQRSWLGLRRLVDAESPTQGSVTDVTN